MSFAKIFTKGIWEENPALVQLLGMCPTLAVTNSATNGLAMGLATTFVLAFSSIFISAMRKIIPKEVRIAAYMIIIATFVTIADYFLKAYLPDISKALGPYVPLIVVNCVILGRQEAFASKNTIFKSILDALGNGFGFVLALTGLGIIREILGNGSIFNITLLGSFYRPMIVMVLPAGAFISLGAVLGLIRAFETKKC